jgi:hypothetical protein
MRTADHGMPVVRAFGATLSLAETAAKDDRFPTRHEIAR